MNRLTPEFVEFIPKELEEGVIYISIRFRTAVHKCACGCGNKTVTRFSPVDWKLIYNGKTVSLSPSIGNWGFPCQSHYWIWENKIEWEDRWSDERIKAKRLLDKIKQINYFSQRTRTKRKKS